jgi:2,3-bisphosphoglycerate-dependent phosphoglycerate mutase
MNMNAHDTVTVVLLRHAQSQWNLENRFTGWADPALTEAGLAEARQAGECLRIHGYRFDMAYSSRLTRAITTSDLILDGIGQPGIPRQQEWRLNERHYGALQGKDKAEAMALAGEEQVWRWRRSYRERAEPLAPGDPGHPRNDPRYADVDPARLPAVENLAETRRRVMAFWNQEIVPHIRRGERLLISAHGNTLRALIMDLAGMDVAEVEGFEIPTATPIIYTFDRDGRARHWRYLDMDCHQAMSA